MIDEKVLSTVATTIVDEILPSLFDNRASIFLIGANSHSKTGLRDQVRKSFKSHYPYYFDIYYPEELFEELFLGKLKLDLLYLENILAYSVHSVVILLESPGAIAELGAFSNHDILRDKLFVVVDKKHKRDKSFIMLGPIRSLDKHSKSKVIFENMKYPNIDRICQMIAHNLFRRRPNLTDIYQFNNPIVAQHFLLAAIFIMEPVKKRYLSLLMQSLGMNSKKELQATITSSLNILFKRREIRNIGGAFEVTKKGNARIKMRSIYNSSAKYTLDKLRILVLNNTLRNKKRNIFKEVASSQIS